MSTTEPSQHQPEELVLPGCKDVLPSWVYIHVIDGGLAHNVVTALEQWIPILHVRQRLTQVSAYSSTLYVYAKIENNYMYTLLYKCLL